MSKYKEKQEVVERGTKNKFVVQKTAMIGDDARPIYWCTREGEAKWILEVDIESGL
jgi:hypothetical protein